MAWLIDRRSQTGKSLVSREADLIAEQTIFLMEAGCLREAAGLRTGFPDRGAAPSRPEGCLPVSRRSLDNFGFLKLSMGPAAISASAGGAAYPEVRECYGLFAAAVREQS